MYWRRIGHGRSIGAPHVASIAGTGLVFVTADGQQPQGQQRNDRFDDFHNSFLVLVLFAVEFKN